MNLAWRTAQRSEDWARSLMAESGLAFPLREEASVTALVEGGRDASLRYPDPLGDVRLSLEPDYEVVEARVPVVAEAKGGVGRCMRCREG